jgi:glucosamine-6-phosphate deaminase
MEPDAVQSYVRFMREQLFDHVDIPSGNWHLPDGTLPLEKVADFCHDYEEQIERYGGLDFQLLGIGRNGHIGFNEPGSLVNSKTRLMTLDLTTRIDLLVILVVWQRFRKKPLPWVSTRLWKRSA